MQMGPTTDASVKAGYADTICSISEANWAAMQKNTLNNIAKKYHNILIRATEEQEDSEAEKKPFLD